MKRHPRVAVGDGSEVQAGTTPRKQDTAVKGPLLPDSTAQEGPPRRAAPFMKKNQPRHGTSCEALLDRQKTVFHPVCTVVTDDPATSIDTESSCVSRTREIDVGDNSFPQ